MRLAILMLVCIGVWAQCSNTSIGGGAVCVSASYTNADTTASTIVTPGSISVAAGDLILVGIGHVFSIDLAGTTVTCGSNSLTRLKHKYDSSDQYVVDLWYKENATAGSTTCTATLPSSAPYRTIAAVNISGIATSSAADGSSCNDSGCTALAASSTSRTAQNITTTNANDLLVGFIIDWNGGLTHTGANSYTILLNGVTPAFAAKAVAATGSYPGGNFSTTNSADQYISIFAAFKLASGGGGGSTTRRRAIITQ